MARVLITGGAGFIGSHVAEAFLDAGHSVNVVDDLSTGDIAWVPTGVRFHHGSVTNLDMMRDLCFDMDGVIHLAAFSRVLPSLHGGPASVLGSFEPNARGTLNVLIAAADRKVGRFVYSASSTCYGNTEAPHVESAEVAPETPYAVSKYIGELYCRQFDRMYDLPTVCLRYFQVYGPRCPSTGPYAMVSSIFIEQAKQGSALTVNGDGSARRDFVHVRDVAEANLRAFESAVRDESINVGTGQSHSIKELADLISPNQVNTPPRAFDMKETLADTGKCARLLGWVPSIGFVAGTRELIDASK